MSEPFDIFTIDDDPVVREVISSLLEADYPVEAFESVEACLPRLEAKKPGMFLLDIELPGMDGYEFCRRLKDDSATSAIPVTFVSSHDTIDERMLAYDAGGQDFIVKPFEPAELLRKVKVAEQLAQHSRMLADQAAAAEYLSSLALASMDEAGIVLQFMSKLIAWDSERDIAAGLLELMQRYRLAGVVQTRIAGRTLTLSAAGENQPLETSVMDHVRGLERIFEFRNRSVHNFDRVTLMVNNMPLEDPEFCGRLRDNLSVAAQGADSRLLAIENAEIKNRAQASLVGAAENIRESIQVLRQAHQRDRVASSELLLELEQDLARSFVHLGLTAGQEEYLEHLVGDFMKRLIALLDRGDDTNDALQRLSDKLGQWQ